MSFRSGFVTIIGKPNAGKSTLLNAMIGEKLSIITSKAQTTRHRIKGILNTKDFQIVFSDTPGVIDAKYALHSSMMKAVNESLEDADVLIFLVDLKKGTLELTELAARYSGISTSSLVVLNKCDLTSEQDLKSAEDKAEELFPKSKVFAVSALQKLHLTSLLEAIVELLPEQPAYFSEDQLTDRSERFVVAEFIREKIFEQFQQEIPYSTEVIINEWKEGKELTKIRADIVVERESQKAILLGKGGIAIKQLGIESRKSIEEFLKQKIFLGLTVKVYPGWRNNPRTLKFFGYEK